MSTIAKVTEPVGKTDYFEIKGSILWGGTFALCLFAVIIDYIMCNTYKGKEEKLEFQLRHWRSRCHYTISLSLPQILQRTQLCRLSKLNRHKKHNCLELKAESAGLFCNSMGAEIQILNQEQPMNLKTRSNELMEVVYSFKYLGAWIKCSQTEFKLWKTMA